MQLRTVGTCAPVSRVVGNAGERARPCRHNDEIEPQGEPLA